MTSLRTTFRLRSVATALGFAVGLSGSVAVAASAADLDVCAGLQAVVLTDGTQLCTHGPDNHLLRLEEGLELAAEALAPATELVSGGGLVGDVAPTDTSAPEAAAGEGAGTAEHVAVPSLPVQCVGDGREGHRVQVLVVDVDGSDHAPATDGDVRRWMGQADWTFAASAQRDGAERRLRFVTTAKGSGCEIAVERVRLTAAEADGYQTTWSSLADKGYNAPERKYAVFVNDDQGICGIATAHNDDAKGAGNASNIRTGFAQVNAPCWGVGDSGYYSVMAHELVHNLGGVQASAPNATKGYHCTDEWDLLCYDDGGHDMTYSCEDTDAETQGATDVNNRLLDCGADDYFNAAPGVEGYLGNHWNVADSAFLSGRPVAAEPEGEPEDAPEGERRGESQPEENEGTFSAAGVGEVAVGAIDLIQQVLELVLGLLNPTAV